jgi:hypothetical protein
MSAYNENDGIPDDDELLDAAIAAAKCTPDEIHDALLQLIGLVDKIAWRQNTPPAIRDALTMDKRYLDARKVAKSYL